MDDNNNNMDYPVQSEQPVQTVQTVQTVQSAQPVQTPPARTFNFSLDYEDMKKLSGWATFIAVMNIISGSLTCLSFALSIFTIVGIFIMAIPGTIAILQIIGAANLLGATSRIKSLIATNDYGKIPEIFSKFKKYFTMNGVVLIISLILIFIVIIFVIVLVAIGISRFGDFNYYNDYNDYGDLKRFFDSFDFIFR